VRTAAIKSYRPDEKAGGRGSGVTAPGGIPPAVRERIAQGFTRVEDVVYIGLGLLLAAGAVVLLADGSLTFGRQVLAGSMPESIIDLLDRVLLVVMIVELLYTVQVSFREHALVPEPFLIVGLIAATRRILVVTAEFAKLAQAGGTVFLHAMLELGLLTIMVLVFVIALVLLRKRSTLVSADRA
jgi:phosphate starvation-inducible membrane PsiE